MTEDHAARPAAWFLARGARVFGPLGREELLGYFRAGMVAAGDTVRGPEWDGALPVAEARERLGITADASVAVPPPLPPLRPAPLAFERAGPGWRAVALALVAMACVQFYLIPRGILGGTHSLGEFVLQVAGRFALVLVGCFLVVGLALRLWRGHWPSARGPLLAMAAIYAGLLVQRFAVPEPAIAVPVAEVAEEVAPASAPAPRPADVADVAPILDTGPVDTGPVATAPAPSRGPDPARVEALLEEIDRRMAASPPERTATPAGPAPAPASDKAIASRLFRAGDWNALLAHALDWTRREPRDWAAWTYLGLAHHRLRHVADAVAAYTRAWELAPGEPLTARNLGDALVAAGDYPRAVQVLEPLVRDHPDDYDARLDYGYAMSLLGEYDEAVEALAQATRLLPDRQKGWAMLGHAHLRAGYPDRARDAFDRANAAARP
jgi:Flp pilus assembly protein TadD